MPNIRCFCVFEYAGTEMKEMDENHKKTTKPGTRVEKDSKAEAGKHFSSPDQYLSSKCQINP